MFKNKHITALIPARGGSKGLKRKNIRDFLGKPLIAWTIEQALSCKYIDKVVVSTEDDEIARIAIEYGATVPFLRPLDIATDSAKAIDVILHAIKWFKSNNNWNCDMLALLQPTSPLRTSQHLEESIELLFNKNAQAIVSVCETDHHPFWSNILPENGFMKDFLRPDIVDKNRQDLPKYYRLNGSIYLAYCDYIINNLGFFGENTYSYIMKVNESVDIDNEIDFKVAEILSNQQIIK
jgi:N-acylneuraminate cytidylyltransferase/CMP-N,N'-diacetyllegionaminic acid synthase